MAVHEMCVSPFALRHTVELSTECLGAGRAGGTLQG